jgi:hypothetical protein
VHERKQLRVECGKMTDRRNRGGRKRRSMEDFFGIERWADYVLVGKRRTIADMGE